MQHARITSLILALLTTACVYAPESGGEFEPGEALVFRGLASRPGATIKLFGYEQRRGEWVELAQVLADATPNKFRYERELYNWQLELRLDEHEDWRCFLSSDCELEQAGDYEARFQVREVDGAVTNLFTYDLGGFECWFDKYRKGDDLFSAYWPCRADAPHEIRLTTPIVQ